MAVVERPVTGGECKLYYNTGTHASPTWVEVTRAINVNVAINKDEADQKSRASGWAGKKGTTKTLEFTFSYLKKQGTDTVFDTLQAAALAGTVKEYAVLDGAITVVGCQGIRAFCELFQLNDTQNLDGSQEIEFVAKYTYTEESSASVEPDWYEVP